MKIDAVEGVIIVVVVLATGAVIYFAVSTGTAKSSTPSKSDAAKVTQRAVTNSSFDVAGSVKAVSQIVTEGTKIFSQLGGLFGGGNSPPIRPVGMDGVDNPDNYG